MRKMGNNEKMIEALQSEIGKGAMEKGALVVLAGRMLNELRDAHAIIRAMLNLLTPEQKAALGEKTADIAPDGITRANEREALIAEASAALLASPEQVAPVVDFSHLAGRGMHELRNDELPAYLVSVGVSYGPRSAEFVEAATWVVSELERKTNDAGVLAVRLAEIREATPTLSAETIDTDEFKLLLVNYRNEWDDVTEPRATLIAHIDARMASARQEGYEQGFIHGQEKIDVIRQKLNKAETALATAREQALEEAARVVESRCIGFKDDDTELREQAAAIRALKSQPATHPAQEAKAQPEIQPAAGLTDAQIEAEYARQLEQCYSAGQPHEPVPNVIAATVRAILAQQPAQAVAALPERDQSKPAEQQGLFRKFEVRRVDGSDQPGGKHHGCRYYVLDLTHDAHAPAAMRAYAASCKDTYPQLAADIEAEFGAATHEGKAGDGLANGYETGFMASEPDGSAIVKLHYRSADTAETAFSAITNSIDAAMQAQQAGKAGA